MHDFDLRDTVAGQQIYEAGTLNGLIEEARDMVIEVLIERFVKVSSEIQESINSVGDHKILKELHRYAIRSPKIEDFMEVLAKVLPISNASKYG